MLIALLLSKPLPSHSDILVLNVGGVEVVERSGRKGSWAVLLLLLLYILPLLKIGEGGKDGTVWFVLR